MSLRIQMDDVVEVFTAGEWWSVAENSFDIDAYEFMYPRDTLYTGEGGGFQFKCLDGGMVYGPLAELKAVKTREGAWEKGASE